jgi:hypothetical protein
MPDNGRHGGLLYLEDLLGKASRPNETRSQNCVTTWTFGSVGCPAKGAWLCTCVDLDGYPSPRFRFMVMIERYSNPCCSSKEPAVDWVYG